MRTTVTSGWTPSLLSAVVEVSLGWDGVRVYRRTLDTAEGRLLRTTVTSGWTLSLLSAVVEVFPSPSSSP